MYFQNDKSSTTTNSDLLDRKAKFVSFSTYSTCSISGR